MGKNDTLFKDRETQKPYPIPRHIPSTYIVHIWEYPRWVRLVQWPRFGEEIHKTNKWRQRMVRHKKINLNYHSLLSAMMIVKTGNKCFVAEKRDNHMFCSPWEVEHYASNKRKYLWLPIVTIPDHRVITIFTRSNFCCLWRHYLSCWFIPNLDFGTTALVRARLALFCNCEVIGAIESLGWSKMSRNSTLTSQVSRGFFH